MVSPTQPDRGLHRSPGPGFFVACRVGRSLRSGERCAQPVGFDSRRRWPLPSTAGGHEAISRRPRINHACGERRRAAQQARPERPVSIRTASGPPLDRRPALREPPDRGRPGVTGPKGPEACCGYVPGALSGPSHGEAQGEQVSRHFAACGSDRNFGLLPSLEVSQSLSGPEATSLEVVGPGTQAGDRGQSPAAHGAGRGVASYRPILEVPTL